MELRRTWVDKCWAGQKQQLLLEAVGGRGVRGVSPGGRPDQSGQSLPGGDRRLWSWVSAPQRLLSSNPIPIPSSTPSSLRTGAWDLGLSEQLCAGLLAWCLPKAPSRSLLFCCPPAHWQALSWSLPHRSLAHRTKSPEDVQREGGDLGRRVLPAVSTRLCSPKELIHSLSQTGCMCK